MKNQNPVSVKEGSRFFTQTMRRPFRKLQIATLALLSGFACGQSLTDGAYQGDALFRVSGAVSSLRPASYGGSPKVGIFWWDFASTVLTADVQGADVTATSFPQGFQLTIYDRPPSVLLNEQVPRGVTAGSIAVVEDVNRDGTLSPSELSRAGILGSAAQHMVLFISHLAPSPREQVAPLPIANPEALHEGFMLLRGTCAADGGVQEVRVVPSEDVPVTSFGPGGSCLMFL